MSDIVERLRKWFKDVNAVSAIDLMDVAANEIERLRPRWIPVTERLPPGDIRVLIWCGNFVDVATLSWKYGWMYDDYGSPEPTHWMPMPEPPEVK
jgi:hypothetical protein